MAKGTKNLMIAVVAVFATALIACLIVLAALPAGTGARYAEDEMYSGVVANDLNSSHTHSGWTAITNDSFSGGMCTITVATSTTVSYYLNSDVTGDIKIETSATSSNNAPVVNICLNGHALTGTGSGSVITIGSPSTSGYVTVNLYDCGGGGGVHCYRYLYEDEDAVVDGEPVPTRYDFSDTSIDTAKPETYDGYVRGGLITGGNTTSQYYGGGVTVGYRATLNMYGGTIAGNEAFGQYSAGGVNVDGGFLNLYGGSIEGNGGLYYGNVTYVAGGVLIRANGYQDQNFQMFGGEIKNNFSAGNGGGISTQTVNTVSRDYLYIYGGVISGNYSANNGGGISTGGGGSIGCMFYIYGGVISGNYSANNGGGIYLGSVTYTYFRGGTVTGNCAGESGGGVCFPNNSGMVLYMKGTPYIYENFAAGKISNLELDNGTNTTVGYITLEGSLDQGARVGITSSLLADHLQITAAYADADELKASAKYFIPDDPSYGIEINGSYLRFYKKST